MPQTPAYHGWGVRVKYSARRAAVGIAAVAVVTLVCERLGANFAVSAFLYLLVVILQSLAGDLLSSVAVSFSAVGCLDYFFVEPVYSLAVSRGMDGIALLSFLVTALVITELVTRVRAETQSAYLQRERLDRLYRLSQQFLAMKPGAPAGKKFLEPFLGVFGSKAICLFDGETFELHAVGCSQNGLAEKTRDAYISGKDTDDRASSIWVRPLQEVAGSLAGAIGFEGLEDPQLTGGPLTTLVAILMERERALQEASDSAAATQAEAYRSAILDALAHEFKTPLATILAAAGGLREAGPLQPEQLEMAEMVETEAARLGSLTSRLLRIARLDREEVRPRMEVMDLTSLLTQSVDHYARRSPDRRICFSQRPLSFEVQADPELLRLALSQLLENACKYSQPGSTVTVQIETQMDYIVIRVSNNGSSISNRDRPRIFERFYRGIVAKRAPGSGLGLYVARKIALAHGGELALETLVQPDDTVTFRLTIPSLKGESDHVVATQ